jgi:hypothetical protein
MLQIAATTLSLALVLKGLGKSAAILAIFEKFFMCLT